MNFFTQNIKFSRSDFWFFLTSNIVFSLLCSVAAKYQLGYKMAYLVIGLSLLSYFVYVHFFGNSLLRRLFYFGIIVGFTELLNDTWLTEVKKVLIYYPGGPFLWDTPLYMPFSWASILITLGYIAAYLTSRLGLVVATIIITVSAGLYIPTFEKIAAEALWWYYVDSPAINSVPWFVILGEFFLALPLPWMIQKIEDTEFSPVIYWAVTEGLIVWFATWFAMTIIRLL